MYSSRNLVIAAIKTKISTIYTKFIPEQLKASTNHAIKFAKVLQSNQSKLWSTAVIAFAAPAVDFEHHNGEEASNASASRPFSYFHGVLLRGGESGAVDGESALWYFDR